MTLCYTIFLLAVLGFVLNRSNVILILLSVEIILLAVTVIWVLSAQSIDDIIGLTFSLFIITVAGAESALGLGLLVAYYRAHGSIRV